MPQTRAEDPRDPINQRILKLLEQKLSTEDIASDVKLHPDTVAYRLRRMEEAGVKGIPSWQERRSNSLSTAWSKPHVRDNWQKRLQEASKSDSVTANRRAGGKRRVENEEEAAKLRENLARARQIKQQKRRQAQGV